MPVEVIQNEHYSKIFNAFQQAKKEIKIITPFIGLDMSTKLANIINKRNLKCTVITRFKCQDFIDCASNIAALKELKKAEVSLFALKKLHTKLYIIDNSVAILGSANFTIGGFKMNHELSIMFTNQNDVISELTQYFDDLIKSIQDSGDWEITMSLIEEEIKEINKIMQQMKGNIEITSYKEFGANFKEIETPEEKSDKIQEVFKTDIPIYDETIWIKFEGVSEDRFDNNSKYVPFIPKILNRTITNFPEKNKPTGMKNGDYIYIAVLSTDEHNVGMPIIIARGRTHGFDKKQKADEEMIKEASWVKKWPIYSLLYDMERLDTEIINGIKLNELLNALQSETYISTQGRAVTIDKLRKSHFQKSHIKITGKAKNYLDKAFEELKEKYGVIKY